MNVIFSLRKVFLFYFSHLLQISLIFHGIIITIIIIAIIITALFYIFCKIFCFLFLSTFPC
jgi:hypothetical protein